MTGLPDVAEIECAELRLRPYLSETPLLFSHDLSDRTGGPVYVKAECLQRTGSFKIRGALNRLAQLTADEKSRGVIAWSSGNHAQGVALAAKLMGTRAIIVMPSDAPEMKVANARKLGAEIIAYDRATEDREAIPCGHRDGGCQPDAESLQDSAIGRQHADGLVVGNRFCPADQRQ